MADRLRVEAEQALGALQERHKDVEGQLAQTLGRQRETDRELESLRAEHRDTCLRLAALSLEQQQQGHTELDKQQHTIGEKRRLGCDNTDKAKERKDSEERQTIRDKLEEEGRGRAEREELEKQKVVQAEMGEKCFEKQNEFQEENKVKNQEGNVEAKSLEVNVKAESHVPKDLNGTGKIQLKGKGVAEAYLRTVAGFEGKREEECGLRNPRRVSLSERSR